MVRSILVLIGGGTCSGKTTLAKKVQSAFPDKCVILSLDAYYRDRSDLSLGKRHALNFDHPDAFEWNLVLQHMSTLLDGSPVNLPIYDFVSHTRRLEAIKVFPKTVIVLEGILALHTKELNSRASLRIFVDLDPALRLQRRLARDHEERGRNEQFTLIHYHDFVLPMHVRFIEPTRDAANLVVSGAEEEGAKVVIQQIAHALANLAKCSTDVATKLGDT